MAAALADHVVVDGVGPVQDTLEVDIDATVPRVCGPAVISQERERHHAGVVDEDVDAPVLGDDLIDSRTDAPAIGHINDTTAFCVLDVEPDDGGAPLGEHAADQQAKTASGTGDDCDLALDV
jgi:hypothetical protein